MHRTKLPKSFLRNRSDENKRKYSNQRNYCVSLLRKTKKNYCSKLNEEKIADNKTFWKTLKPFLSDKTPSDEKITLIEKDKIIKIDTKAANVLNTLFSTIISNLNIPEYPVSDPISNDINDPVLKSILKYKVHPCIKAIEKISKLNNLFKISNVEKREVLNAIFNLDVSKSCQDTDVPTKNIKENADIFADFIHPAINASVNKKEFRSFLKLADVIPAFKKGSKNSKNNFWPISILKNISKVYESVIFKQIGDFMENFFSKFQCRFRKGYTTQQCLIALIEKWKSVTDKGKSFGPLLI